MRLTPLSYPALIKQEIRVRTVSYSYLENRTTIVFDFVNNQFRLYPGKQIHFIYNQELYIAKYDKNNNQNILLIPDEIVTLDTDYVLSIYETFKVDNDNEVITIQDAHEKLVSTKAILDKNKVISLGEEGLLTGIDKLKLDQNLINILIPTVSVSTTYVEIINFKIYTDVLNQYRVLLSSETNDKSVSFDLFATSISGTINYIALKNIVIDNVTYKIRLTEKTSGGNQYLTIELATKIGTENLAGIISVKTIEDAVVSNNITVTASKSIKIANDIEIELNNRLISADTFGMQMLPDHGDSILDPRLIDNHIYELTPGYYYLFENINSLEEIEKIGLDDNDGINLEVFYNGQINDQKLIDACHCWMTTTKSNRVFFGTFYPEDQPNTVNWFEIQDKDKITTDDVKEAEDTEKLFLTPAERQKIAALVIYVQRIHWKEPVADKATLIALDTTGILIGSCCTVIDDETHGNKMVQYQLKPNKTWEEVSSTYYINVTTLNDGILTKEDYIKFLNYGFGKKIRDNIYVHKENNDEWYSDEGIVNLIDLVKRDVFEEDSVGEKSIQLGYTIKGKENSIVIGSNISGGVGTINIGQTNVNLNDFNVIVDYGILIGTGLKATLNKQIILGNWNKASDSVFQIGNGNSNDDRNNIFEISSTGKVKALGYIIPEANDDFILSDGTHVERSMYVLQSDFSKFDIMEALLTGYDPSVVDEVMPLEQTDTLALALAKLEYNIQTGGGGLVRQVITGNGLMFDKGTLWMELATVTDPDTNVVGKGGAMTFQEHLKLAGIESQADNNPVNSVAGKIGVVTLIRTDVIGIENVDNTTDAAKPVTTAETTELSKLVDKIEGKGLSSNDYVTEDKTKLAGIQTGAQKNAVTAVNTRTGAITLDKTDVGLDQVDNIADANKEVSFATTTDVGNKLGNTITFGNGASASYDGSAEVTVNIGYKLEPPDPDVPPQSSPIGGIIADGVTCEVVDGVLSIIPAGDTSVIDSAKKLMREYLTSKWTLSTSPIAGLRFVTYSPKLKLFVALSSSTNGGLCWSVDAITWTKSASETDIPAPYSIAWSEEKEFFITLGNTTAYKSVDGKTWNAITFPIMSNLRSIIWCKEKNIFIIIGFNVCITSPDGVTWTTQNIPTGNWYIVFYGKSLFLALGSGDDENGNLITSPDGITWTRQTLFTGDWDNGVYAKSLKLFIIVSYDGGANAIATSPDGITWTRRTTPSTLGNIFGMCWCEELGICIVVGKTTSTSTNMMTSTDGINWTILNTAIYGNKSCIIWCFDQARFVMVGDSTTANSIGISY
jgi:hypothetical protein